MELIARSEVYTPYENGESNAHLEVYRLPKGFIEYIEENCMSTDEIMEELGFSNRRGFVEPGTIYSEYTFVSLNTITNILVVEVTQSLNI